ncbi:MAG: hypothetical protein R3B36_08040 [Polyangiaceae bacterium]
MALRRSFFLSVALGAAAALGTSTSSAQPQPPPTQPYPPANPGQPPAQPYPQQYPPQQYPPQYPGAQPQPYPQPAQPYPQQYPPQQYPPQQYPPQQYPPQQYPPQPYPPQPPPQPSDTRSRGEMTFLYVSSALYGVGTGIWLDALFKIKDPGVAAIMPITFGAAMPIGVFLWDDYGGPLHRGVPSSISTGLVLGAVEGIAIAGTQWQHTRDAGNDWSFQTQTTATWIMATGGGVGGWAFGEWLRPDPRSLSFIASGAAWGAISGTLFGAGVSGRDWKDAGSIAGLVGYNVGILGTGALSVAYTPSYNTQKYMWMGYGIGTLAGFLVYPFYLFVDDADVKRGLIANSLGGLAGAALGGVLTWDMRDDGDGPRTRTFKTPFDVAVLPPPPLAQSATQGLTPTRATMAPPSGLTLNALGKF